MPKLKAEFRKPKLTLYNTNYVALGVLTNRTHLSAHNIVLNEQVNETPSLTFDFPMGGMLDGDSLELLIKYKNEYFVIKEISMSDSDTAIMNVRAEHIACELKGIMVGYFEDLIGETPETMWSTVIENSSMTEVLNDKYIFETNITNTFRWLGSEEEKSVFEYLLTIAQQFDSCLLFSTDTYGKIHIELLHGDINRNKFIRKGKDLKQLNLTFNTESLFTKLTPFGGTDDDGIEVNIMNVNDGKSYITNYDYYLAKGMTQAEIDANPLCNQECVYRNEEVLDEDELLRLAQEELRRLSEPVVEGSISAIDLNVFEGGSYLSPILCEKVVVIDKDLKYSISCKITSIGLNFENPLESQIGISNVISYSSNLKDLIRNSEIVDRVITNGDNGRPNLNASKVKGIIDGHIAQLKYSMEDNITDVTDAVVLFENRIEGSSMYGALAIGSRGILISTKIDRVTNQWIWSTAIDAKGLSTQIVNAIEINGSQIRGDKISSYDEKTWINLDDGTFNFANRMFYDGQKFTIHLGDGTDLDEWKQQYEGDKALMDTELQDIKDSLGNLDDIIGDTFSDGIITEVERIRIEDSLIDLEKEKEDIKNRYTLIVNDVGLTGGEEDALKSAYTSFNAKYTQLVQVINNVISDDKATESEKTNYQSKLREYNETIPPLTVAFDNALKKIAENKAKTLINETKSDIERDIQNVQQSVDGLEETMLNSFRDGIIDETEYKTIKESVHRLNSEKLDIDRNYEHLSVNIYIQSKTELLREFKDAYDNYVENHETLTSYVDETIGDRVATEEEITNINDMFNSYDEALAEYSVMQTKVMSEIADATASSNLDEYKEIVNRDITDVNTRINNLILDVGGAISDNILDQAELRIIENSITALETEKADVDKRYTELMKDTVNFKGDARSALSNSYSNFNTAHTNLINSINDMIDENYATELEKQVYQGAVNSYNTALSTLSSAFDKALNEIAKNSAQAIMETIRQEIQSDISDVQDNIDALEDYMGNAFRDGILSDAEKESIRTHLLTLATEKKDVEQQYTSLIGMADLVGTAKTNLQNAYGNESKGYVQAYNSLINTINQILNKTTVNASDRTNLTNSFNNHDAKLANYSLRVNEAIESISEKKKQDLNNTITAKIEVLENAISLRVTETRMEEIIESTQLQFNALQDMTNSLQNQVDGKIQTHYQSTDPSKNWTSTEKTAHEGDIWHDTLNNFTYRWNGSAWNKLTDADAEEAKTLANSKAQIFVNTPTTPYYIGDLWVQGGNYDGEIMRCINTRTSGKYTANDWSKASKYTDDSFATQLEERLDNLVIGGRNLLKNTAEQVMTLTGGTNVVRRLTLTVPGSEIVGIDTTLSFDWRYEGDNASNGGTFKIQTGNPQYHGYGDTITISSTNTSGRFVFTRKISTEKATFTVLEIRCDNIVGNMIFTNIKLEKGNTVTDWSPAPEDTTDYTDNLVYDLQGQIDNKIETHNQTADPSTSWTTTELKNKHKGDLWYNPSTKITKRWSGTAWVEQPEAETLAKTKKRVFTSTPTVPYDIGDLWVTSLDGNGEIKTCKTAKTSSQSYSASDWVAPKYTDDSTANRAIEQISEINVELGEIDLRVSEKITESINGIKIGGRNLLKNTAEQVMTLTGGENIVRALALTVPASEIVGIDTTLSFDWRYEGDNASNGGAFKFQTGAPQYLNYNKNITISSTNTSGRLVFTNKISSEKATFTSLNIRCDNIVGDMIFTNIKLEKGNTATDWSPAPEDTIDYADNLIYDLQSQLDGKIQTYYQPSDPSTAWTDEATKTQHTGDLWYDINSVKMKRWNGISWVAITDKDASEAKKLAQTKAQIFTSTPTPPYYKGDLWCRASDEEIMRSKANRTSGSYVESDWVKASKYTDDSRADEIADDLANNYYTITETESAINVSKEGILSTVSSTYTTKNEMGNTLANYAKKSDLSQTADSITATFTSSGGGNLVRNGDLKNGTKFWAERLYNLAGSDLNRSWHLLNNEYTGYEPTLELVIENLSSGEYAVYQTIETVVGRQYVLTCYLAGRRGNYGARVRGTVDDKWGLLASRSYGAVEGGSNPNNWHRVVIPFVAERTETMIDFQITSSTASNTKMWIKRVMVCEGTVWTPFVPHSSEIYTGITKIDQDGIEVSHSQVSTKSQMTASGFFINDNNGDVIAELSSTNQWSILRADEVYAKNIERVYMGDANLYVDHSKGTCGTGTSSSPFNSFSALTAHFEAKGVILNKDVTIYVVSTGNVSDNLDIRGLSGRGTLNIKLDKSLILNSNSVAESAIYFYDCNTIITVNGGRSAWNSTDGALLNKWGCGVRFTKCKYGRVEEIAVDSAKNNKIGVMFDATDGIVDNVDTCTSYHGLWATRGSQVYQYDCCGSASTSYYSGEGALILIGGEANGIKINGSYKRVSGNILDFGTNPTGKASYRTPPAVPSTSDKWQSFTYSDYGYFTPGQDGINVNSWNPNGKKVYQGNWG